MSLKYDIKLTLGEMIYTERGHHALFFGVKGQNLKEKYIFCCKDLLSWRIISLEEPEKYEDKIREIL